MTWYSQGEEGRKNVEAAQKKQEEDFKKPQRFWIPPDSNTDIVFLDSEGFFFKEHNYQSGGSWQNWETCISEMGEECPFCDDGIRSSYVAAFTIIDLSPFHTKKDNIAVTASKKLFVLKGLTIKKFLKKRDAQGGDITFCQFNTTRYEKKEASTGTDFEFKSRLDEAAVHNMRQISGPYSVAEDEWLKPFDYMEIFKPKNADELRRILGRPAPVGGNADLAGSRPAGVAGASSNVNAETDAF